MKLFGVRLENGKYPTLSLFFEQAYERSGPQKGPQQVGHGESDMLPVAVRKYMALPGHPLLGGFKTAGAAGL